jgi:catechol 2,3-dioxygenase-like lactoylglutathione lyase family enzyme
MDYRFEVVQVPVADIDVACAELGGRGVALSEIEELGRPGRRGFRFMYFDDPDGNAWIVQEIPPTQEPA